MSKTVIEITGMTCSHCEKSVAEELMKVQGVTLASADHSTGTASVEGSSITHQDLADAVEEAGYQSVGFKTSDG